MERISMIRAIMSGTATAINAVTPIIKLVFPDTWLAARSRDKKNIQKRFATAKPNAKAESIRVKPRRKTPPSKLALRFFQLTAILEIAFCVYQFYSIHAPRLSVGDQLFLSLLGATILEMV